MTAVAGTVVLNAKTVAGTSLHRTLKVVDVNMSLVPLPSPRIIGQFIALTIAPTTIDKKMKDLLIWVTSWKRPSHLKMTLDTIVACADISHDIFVVDNESTPETAAVIQNHPAVSGHWLLPTNTGINWPIENLLPMVLAHRYVMISDHDVFFARPFSLFINLLQAFPGIGATKGHDSPEHPTDETLDYKTDTWHVKTTERGGGLVVPADWLLGTFPLPKANTEFDVHMMQKLGQAGKKVAILPKSAVHTGWQLGDSTWQAIEIPERYILVDGKIVEKT